MRYTVCVDRLLQKTAAALAPYGNKRIAIGVSGGRDSVCLLHAVIGCGAADKNNVTVVHVNHNLRDTAARDEDFVRELCLKINVKFKAFSVDVRKTAALNGHTVEQAARELRYGIFYDLIKSGEADAILTAHHALDNAETVLMHLFRGAGLDGLRGIKNSDHTAESAYILRPFIDVYPEALDEFVRKNSLEFVVDETNLVADADRNFIRLNVIPLIEQRYSGAVRAVNALAAECKSVCAYLDGALDTSLISYDRGAAVIAESALRGALSARYVRTALDGYFTSVDVTREQIMRTAELVNARTGATVELTGGINATREYGGVALYIPRAFNAAETPVRLGANFIDGLAVDIVEDDADPKSVRGGAVDLDKLKGAVLRFRRDGDTFTPCGGVTKKVQRYFVDEKTEKRKRDRIPLICRGSEVLVIVGVQVSELVKQMPATTHKAVVRLRR